MRRNVTFNEFHATEHLAVNVIEDDITERTRIFGVRIIVPADAQQLGVLLGAPSELFVTIIDDDRKLLFLCIPNWLLQKFVAGELEITVFTNTTGDELNGYIIQLYFDANQDEVTYRCRINDLPFIPCKK